MMSTAGPAPLRIALAYHRAGSAPSVVGCGRDESELAVLSNAEKRKPPPMRRSPGSHSAIAVAVLPSAVPSGTVVLRVTTLEIAPVSPLSPFAPVAPVSPLGPWGPVVNWLIDGVVERGTLTLIAGREKEGKSLLSFAFCASVCSGGGMIAGIDCKAGRVLVIDAENGEKEIHRRVRALGLAREHAERLTVAETRGFDLRGDLAVLDALLVETRPDLVVLDSFRSLWTGDENDSGAVSSVLDPLRNLIRSHDAAALLIHHMRKDGGYRGNSAIGSSVENILELVSRAPLGATARSRR